MRVLLFLIVILFISGGTLALFMEPGGDEPRMAGAEVPSQIASACAIGEPGSRNIVAVTGSFELRTSPSESGSRIKNEKASAIIREDHYHQIDSSTTVKQVCADGEWSEVQIVSPEWLTFVKGWVPNKILRKIKRTADGNRVYVEPDFAWDKDTSTYKTQIIDMVNKIAREHEGCSTVETASVALSPSKSKPKDPVFFVTCTPDGTPFNVWFRPSGVYK